MWHRIPFLGACAPAASWWHSRENTNWEEDELQPPQSLLSVCALVYVPICPVIAQKNVSFIYVKKFADEESLFLKVAAKKLNLVMAKIAKILF